jgi:hypothetical protein
VADEDEAFQLKRLDHGLGVVGEIHDAIALARCVRFAVAAGRYFDGLEQELQVRLLQRTTRRLRLTEAGELYYRRSRRILEELEEAQKS